MTYPTIEEIVLRHSGRGMTVLQKYLDDGYCRHAAKRILELPRGTVLLTTGFCVQGAPETDGPPGTMAVAHALEMLGFTPVIVTDEICRGLFEPEHLEVEYVSLDADIRFYRKLLKRYEPVCMISIERCGRNINDDYANMRGISIAGQTACIDTLFELAEHESILTVGIGDGGNEIGMGNLKDVILNQLSLVPCAVTVDELIIATTSNWGAYALVAYLERLSHTHVLLSFEDMSRYMDQIISLGCIDGVTKRPEPGVDGFSMEVEKEILDALASC